MNEEFLQAQLPVLLADVSGSECYQHARIQALERQIILLFSYIHVYTSLVGDPNELNREGYTYTVTYRVYIHAYIHLLRG